MELVKASIEILNSDRRRIEVQFNPNTLAFRKEAVINEIGLPGLGSPLLQFVRGEAETLDLELFCDTTHDGLAQDARDVREHTQPIRSLLEVDPVLRAIPVVRFSWGKGLSFTGVAVSIEQSFTLFSPAGVPLRARLAVKLKEYRTLAEQLVPMRARRAVEASSEAAAGVRIGTAEADPGGPSASHALLPSTLLHHIEIRRAGKVLAPATSGDLLRFSFRDQRKSEDEFELTLNDWDAERLCFKYSDTSLFDPGRSLEIRFRAPLVKSARTFVKGAITRVRQASPARGQPTLVVIGRADEPQRAGRSPTVPLRLAYGESLIEIESELARAPESARPKRSKTRSGTVVSLIGTCSGLSELRAGARVDIEGIGKRFAGRYHVFATTHTIDDSGYTTRFECRKDDAKPPKTP